jgi:hypothetical protein
MKNKSKNIILNETHSKIAEMFHKFPVIVQEFPIILGLFILLKNFTDKLS